MGVLDKFKRNIQTNDAYTDNYDDYYDDYEGGYDEMPAEEPMMDTQPQAFAYTPQPSSNPLSSGMSLNGAAIELKVVKPTEFKDGPSIADHLLSTRTVVLNLEDADKDTARRLIDFLFGVAYSIGGEIKKVANNAYVITPQNVAISNDKATAQTEPEVVTEPAQNNGFFGY